MENPVPTRNSLACLTAVALLLAAAPAVADGPPATTSVWGYSGLVLMPTAAVHGFRDFSVGAAVMTKTPTFAAVPFVSAGIFDGLEATVLYGVPLAGFSGLSGSAKYQLIRPTKERPTAVAVGLNLIGVNGVDRFVEGNDLYMVVSQDLNTNINGAAFTLATAHFGFEGNLTGARLMAGLELPLGNTASLFGDYMGPLGTAGGYFNVGAAYRPLREWQVRAYTMGNPGGALTDRDYCVGISYWGNILGKPQEAGDRVGAVPSSPTPRPSAKPSAKPSGKPPAATPKPSAKPSPTPSPALRFGFLPVATPTPAPTPQPTPAADATASLRGTLLDDKGRALTGWSVGVPGANHWAPTDLKGRYILELPLGPYELTVRDAQGKVYLTKPIRLVTPQGMDLPLVVSLPVGDLKGMVIDKATKQGISDATIQLFRAGETYALTGRDNGAFRSADLPAGEYRIVVTRSRYKAFEGTFALAAKQERSMVVALEPKSGSLAGKVTNLKGQGQPGVTVAIPKLQLTAATDRLGAYLFADLPPGQHELIVTQGQRRVSTTLVRIRSDETTTENVTVSAAEVAQPGSKAGQIAGTVVDAGTKRPLAGVKIVVEGGDLTVLTITGSDGRYAVGDLPPGRYKVTASRAGYTTKPSAAAVTAKAGAVVNVGLAAGR
ncbi:MAG: hypothetical protein JWM80_1288 [Cyanobacteria bacterium RYN_339]|nr:hypothetical protein [Cyanobacteria bacterium RYN_339]